MTSTSQPQESPKTNNGAVTRGMKRIRRVTSKDIRSAGLRRWDGRGRVTTDWINIFHEPELCWPTGDCLVYLREPGQSSRGPAFRIHTAFLKLKGFESLVDRVVTRNSVHAAVQCNLPNCAGCDPQQNVQELYIPAPVGAGVEETFNHHITTRNFFAWLYTRPLAGRTLGKALVTLKSRIDDYRPELASQNKLEVLSYAENQRYLDFRECVDHALASLYLAEKFEVEDLWVDAFAHCVGMSHRGLRSSIEYASVSTKTKALINRARLEMDLRLDRVNNAINTFFEHECSGSFLGLPQTARDHLENFRAFLKNFYAKEHGCWPPQDFADEAVQQALYASMFSDIRSLYQHLVDASSVDATEQNVTKSGGVCTLQNIQAFDAKYSYEPLAQTLPLLPETFDAEDVQRVKSQRRMSWNPMLKRKAAKGARRAHDKQSLVTASNRDLLVMDCPLVRQYSEFEESSVDDDLQDLSAIEARKVRWILIYAMLQTFNSISQPPKEVRNTSNLTYSLCCRPPSRKPWQEQQLPEVTTVSRTKSQLAPDNSYSHTNLSSASLGETLVRGRSERARRQSLPAGLSNSVLASLSLKTPSNSRSASLRRLVSRRSRTVDATVPQAPTKKPSFCQIYVEGYGNGMHRATGSDSATSTSGSRPLNDVIVEVVEEPQEMPADNAVQELPAEKLEDLPPLPDSDGCITTPSMSRESSKSSHSQPLSSGTEDDSEVEPTTPVKKKIMTLVEILQASGIKTQDPTKHVDEWSKPIEHSLFEDGADHVKIVDSELAEPEGEPSYIHFNTETWDRMLEQLPRPQSVGA